MNDFVESCKAAAVEEMKIFLRNFSYVPDDKLNWTPTATAKSALRVAAHTALYSSRFANMIRNRALPKVDDLEAWLAQRTAEEVAITTREEAINAYKAGIDEVIEALDGLSDADVESSLDSGMGWSMSMKWLMKLPAWHATLHTGQIDFLQTCWGDQEVYVQ